MTTKEPNIMFGFFNPETGAAWTDQEKKEATKQELRRQSLAKQTKPQAERPRKRSRPFKPYWGGD
jgi:hypothetical protein